VSKEDVKLAESMHLRHAAPVISAHFTADGSRLVTATGDDANIWDTTTGELLYACPYVGNVLADALLLPDNRHLFLGDIAFGDSYLRDLTTGAVTTTSTMIQAQCVALAPAQRGILIASWDDHLRGAVQLLDEQTTQLVRSYATQLDGMIMRVIVSRDSRRFLALQVCFSVWSDIVGDDVIFLFDLDTGQPLRRFAGPSSMYDVAFVPGEREVAASYAEGVLWWDIATGEVAGQYRRPHRPITSLAFAPSGKVLAVGCEDGTVLLVSWPDLHVLHRFSDQAKRINRLAFSPDGRLLASTSEDETACLRHVAA